MVLVLIAATLIVFSKRRDLFPGLGTPVRIATVAILVVLGWTLARSLARGVAAPLFRRLDPGSVEELEGDHVLLRISATPSRPADGGKLASEVLAAARSQR